MKLRTQINLIFASLIILIKPNNTTPDDTHCSKSDPGDLLQPGRGWDAVTSRIKSPIFLPGPLKCKQRFLKGENVMLTDVDEILLRTDLLGFYPNVFYPVTALNLSLNRHPWIPIDGFFTKGYQNIIKRKIENRLLTNRILLRRVVLRLTLIKSPPIHPNFEKRIMRVAKSINSRNYFLAKLQMDLIVRDYGTHFITRTDMGAIYIQQDLLSYDLLVAKSDSDIDDISLAGRFLFQKKCNFTHNANPVSDAILNEYSEVLRNSLRKFIGGAKTDVCSEYNEWYNSVNRKMEVVDRNGKLLDEIMNLRDQFPKFNDPSVYDNLTIMLRDAIGDYYALNTHAGCLNLDSVNFDAVANFDDGSCIRAAKKWPVGERKYYGAVLTPPPYEPEPELLNGHNLKGDSNKSENLCTIYCFHLISAIIFLYTVLFG